jgi:hypothetical protein
VITKARNARRSLSKTLDVSPGGPKSAQQLTFNDALTPGAQMCTRTALGSPPGSEQARHNAAAPSLPWFNEMARIPAPPSPAVRPVSRTCLRRETPSATGDSVGQIQGKEILYGSGLSSGDTGCC